MFSFVSADLSESPLDTGLFNIVGDRLSASARNDYLHDDFTWISLESPAPRYPSAIIRSTSVKHSFFVVNCWLLSFLNSTFRSISVTARTASEWRSNNRCNWCPKKHVWPIKSMSIASKSYLFSLIVVKSSSSSSSDYNGVVKEENRDRWLRKLGQCDVRFSLSRFRMSIDRSVDWCVVLDTSARKFDNWKINTKRRFRCGAKKKRWRMEVNWPKWSIRNMKMSNICPIKSYRRTSSRWPISAKRWKMLIFSSLSFHINSSRKLANSWKTKWRKPLLLWHWSKFVRPVSLDWSIVRWIGFLGFLRRWENQRASSRLGDHLENVEYSVSLSDGRCVAIRRKFERPDLVQRHFSEHRQRSGGKDFLRSDRRISRWET